MPLTKSTPTGEVIKDFQNSDNPKFAGKSKEKRRQMAIAASYKLHKESVDSLISTLSENGHSDVVDDIFTQIMLNKITDRLEEMKSSVMESILTIDEAVSRKDFQLAADTIKQIPDLDDRQKAANLHAQIFAKSNPRFNHALFHAAAGTKVGE